MYPTSSSGVRRSCITHHLRLAVHLCQSMPTSLSLARRARNLLSLASLSLSHGSYPPVLEPMRHTILHNPLQVAHTQGYATDNPPVPRTAITCWSTLHARSSPAATQRDATDNRNTPCYDRTPKRGARIPYGRPESSDGDNR